MRLKRLVFSLLMLLVPLAFITPVYAQVDISSGICDEVAPGTGEKPSICTDIEATQAKQASNGNVIYGKDGVLTRAISILSIAVGVIAIIVMIIAGIKMMLSQGDPGKIASSRSQIIYALVGVTVAVLAQTVVQLVLNRIGVN